MIPRCPNEGDAGHRYNVITYWEKLVADYARISLFDVQDMDYICYLQLRRDAWIHSLNQTEGGRKYLEDAWILEQTKPDRKKLREKFGKTKG